MAQVDSLKTGKKFKKTEIGKIPVDWKIAKLRDVAQINMGQSPPSVDCFDYKNGLPFFQGTAEFGTKYPTVNKWCNSPRKVAGRGDILVSVRAPVGDVNVAPEECCIGRGLAAIRGTKSDNSFLYFIMNFVRKSLVQIGQGSTFEAINKNVLFELTIPFPSLPEQKKIAEILTTVDDAIEKSDEVIEKTKELKKGLMQQLLTRGIGHTKFKKTKIGEIPVDWRVLRLQDIVEEKRGSIKRGPFGGSIKKAFFVSDGYKIYEQKNVIYEDFELGDYYIDENKFDELQDFEIKPKDLLISCSGTIGKIVIVPCDVPKGIINQALLRITLDFRKMTPDFFKYLVEAEYMQKKIIAHTHGSAMKNIVSIQALKKISLGVPSVDEQKKIVNILSHIDTEIEHLITDKRKLKQLKKGLMQVLLTGKVRVRI